LFGRRSRLLDQGATGNQLREHRLRLAGGDLPALTKVSLKFHFLLSTSEWMARHRLCRRIAEQQSLLTGLQTCKEADVWSLGLSPVVLIRAYALPGTRLRVDSKYSTDNQIFSQAILKNFPVRFVGAARYA
jgi:hypothetical protein